MDNTKMRSTASIVTAVLIFGTIGIFRRYIPLPSATIACVRGIVAAVFLLGIMAVSKKMPSPSDVKKNILPLCLSGVFLGLNWIFLFESYNYTTVSCATLCYYTAPVYVALLSPVVLGDRVPMPKIMCTAAALFGMVLASGITDDSAGAGSRGIMCGLLAAVFYASLTVTNKKLDGINSMDRSIVQISVATVTVLPYALIAERTEVLEAIPKMTVFAGVMLVLMGILHTAVAFTLYFSSLMGLKAQTAALLSYIDPVTALVLSAVILGERMTVLQIAGAVLVIGSAVLGEVIPSEKRRI